MTLETNVKVKISYYVVLNVGVICEGPTHKLYSSLVYFISAKQTL